MKTKVTVHQVTDSQGSFTEEVTEHIHSVTLADTSKGINVDVKCYAADLEDACPRAFALYDRVRAEADVRVAQRNQGAGK